MTEVHLVRTAAVEPFWTTLKRMGAPVRILGKESALPVDAVRAEWADVEIEWGHTLTSIFIPTLELKSPPQPLPGKRNSASARTRQPQFHELVARHVHWGDVGLEKAANETGLTVITLQRWLRKQDTSYSTLVEIALSKRAQKLLRRTDRTIAMIAKDLGYRHQSNFTRAFERMVGVSPSAFRNQSNVA